MLYIAGALMVILVAADLLELPARRAAARREL
jgi:hypothetical protein